MSFFYFLGEKKFYIHLLIAILVCILLLWLVLKSLDGFTRHGDVYVVPDFTGLTIKQLEEKKYDEFFQIEVIDSVYDKILRKGEVIMQNPLPESKVKKGRHIYLTIVSEKPETIFMPNLKNLSLRQALVTLESNDLAVGRLDYIDYFARNAVVEQLFDGRSIDPGTEILKGSIIDLQVGKGETLTSVPVPMMIGKKKSEVGKILHYAYLNIGNEYYLDGIDTAKARVYKTSPETMQNNRLKLGDSINIWYKSDENFDFDEYIKNYTPDTLSTDTVLMPNSIEQND